MLVLASKRADGKLVQVSLSEVAILNVEQPRCLPPSSGYSC